MPKLSWQNAGNSGHPTLPVLLPVDGPLGTAEGSNNAARTSCGTNAWTPRMYQHKQQLLPTCLSSGAAAHRDVDAERACQQSGVGTDCNNIASAMDLHTRCTS